MARRAALFVALAFLLLPNSPLAAASPRPAPPIYATANYGLTFRTPPGLTYCRLPRDWVGSDHGTILFLERPRSCGGAGYPSSNRGFAPDVARIDLYYGYVTWDNPQLQQCRGERLRFLGTRRPICIERDGARVRATIQNWYHSVHGAVGSEAVLTLVTRPSRLAADLRVLRRLAAGLRPCSSVWPRPGGGSSIEGCGPRCPNVGWY